MLIAIASDNKKVAAHFGHCQAFECFYIKDGEVGEWKTIPNPGHQPGFLPNFLHEQGVRTIIAGGMGQSAANLFNNHGIEVVSGASGPIYKVATDYVTGNLSTGGSFCEEHNH
jgi:predicted Fe-Mo cluster-binding NifX family protein